MHLMKVFFVDKHEEISLVVVTDNPRLEEELTEAIEQDKVAVGVLRWGGMKADWKIFWWWEDKKYYDPVGAMIERFEASGKMDTLLTDWKVS